MLVDRVGQLVVLLLGDDAVVDDLAIGAVLLELGRAFAQVGGLPEGGSGALALVEDLLLLEEFHEQSVPGRGRNKNSKAEGGVGKQPPRFARGHQSHWRAFDGGGCGGGPGVNFCSYKK